MRRACVVVVALAAVLLVPGTAFAATAEPAGAQKDLVVFSGDAVVNADQTGSSVVVFDGDATVDGTVTGAVVVFSGATQISGDVQGDVVVFDGSLTVQQGAHISGDVFADRRQIAPGAQVDGSVQSTARFAAGSGWAWVALWIGAWIAVGISLLLLGLILLWFAPKAADRVIETGRTAVGASAGWGAILFFGLPLIAVLAMVTVIGLPVGLVLLFALGLIYGIGYVAGAWFVGRMVMKTGSRAGAFALGWLIVTVVSLIPGLGGVAWLCATGYGLGILAVAAFRASRRDDTLVVPEARPVPPKPATV